jgi:hypothetical protein
MEHEPALLRLSPIDAGESHFPYSRSRSGGYIKGAQVEGAENGP